MRLSMRKKAMPWHGSNDNFDSFEAVYLGTGVGSAYGKGFYFAENAEATEDYYSQRAYIDGEDIRDYIEEYGHSLAGMLLRFVMQAFSQNRIPMPKIVQWLEHFQDDKLTMDDVAKLSGEYKNYYTDLNGLSNSERQAVVAEVLNAIEHMHIKTDGYLYEAELWENVDKSTIVVWNDYVPEWLLTAVKEDFPDIEKLMSERQNPDNKTYGSLYHILYWKVPRSIGVTEYLKTKGVRGVIVKFREGNYYVVFFSEDIRIINKQKVASI